MRKAVALMSIAAAAMSMGYEQPYAQSKGTKYATWRKSQLNTSQKKKRQKEKSARKSRKINRK